MEHEKSIFRFIHQVSEEFSGSRQLFDNTRWIGQQINCILLFIKRYDPSISGKSQCRDKYKKKFQLYKNTKKKLRKTCQGIQKDIIIKYNMPSLHSNSIDTLNS